MAAFAAAEKPFSIVSSEIVEMQYDPSGKYDVVSFTIDGLFSANTVVIRLLIITNAEMIIA